MRLGLYRCGLHRKDVGSLSQECLGRCEGVGMLVAEGLSDEEVMLLL